MILKFRFLSSENEDFVRDIEIENNKTFLDLHKAIQLAVPFDSNMLASFFLASDCWQKGLEITLEKMEEENLAMHEAELKEYIDEEKQKVLYVFDYFSERSLFAELVSITTPKEGIEYPVCSQSKGDAPPQFIEPEF
jgi:Plasmid pRiA4b ORF-3-like protein